MDLVQDYVQSFIEGLHDDGNVENFVICPGSRSTPLVLAVSKNKKRVRTWTLYDERSAAFFALGMAKSTNVPAALICTSGTATANFMPAVVEARLSRVPIVVITADRPPELRDFGAPQTIDQVRIYGSYAKWFQEMPIAEDFKPLFRFSRLIGARAAYVSTSSPAGPVHINFPFREPLLSKSSSSVALLEESHNRAATTRVRESPYMDDVRRVLEGIRHGSKGIVVVGPGDCSDLRDELSKLASSLRWPILADPLSNLRQHHKPPAGLVRCYEFLLRDKVFRGSKAPRWVIRIGGAPTSKELNSFCERAETIILDDAVGDWRDPSLSLSRMIYGELATSLSMIHDAMAGFEGPKGWLEDWLDSDARVSKIVDSVMSKIDEPFEGKLFYCLSRILQPSSRLTVVVGNSMPIRDLDIFFLKGSENVRFMGNKGANGIDGLVSTAMGVSALEGNVLLILGDVSFYHDMNGLLAAKLHKLNATIIVVNNKGGGIFSFLPQHALLPKQTFEDLFGMSHDLDFSGVKSIYGGQFYRVDSWQAFDKALSSSLEGSGLKVIEFMAADRETNLALHTSTLDKISLSVTEK